MFDESFNVKFLLHCTNKIYIFTIFINQLIGHFIHCRMCECSQRFVCFTLGAIATIGCSSRLVMWPLTTKPLSQFLHSHPSLTPLTPPSPLLVLAPTPHTPRSLLTSLSFTRALTPFCTPYILEHAPASIVCQLVSSSRTPGTDAHITLFSSAAHDSIVNYNHRFE